MPALCQRTRRQSLGVFFLGDRSEAVGEHPTPRFVALRLSERTRVEGVPDRERMAGELRRLDRINMAASGQEQKDSRRSFGVTFPSPAAVAAASTPRVATLRWFSGVPACEQKTRSSSPPRPATSSDASNSTSIRSTAGKRGTVR